MPKLKDVKVSGDSMSWTDISICTSGRMKLTSIPKRELENFLSDGYEIEEITLTFKKKGKE